MKDTIEARRAYFKDAIKEAYERYPDSVDAIQFLAAAFDPGAELTPEDIFWAQNTFKHMEKHAV